MYLAAVVFDLDGVLVDSEHLWDSARRELVAERGGSWTDDATDAMMGMSSPEWSRYVRDELGVDLEPQAISAAVIERLERLYREQLPLLPGAREAVIAASARWPVGLASSSNREIIDLVLELAELGSSFDTTVSSEEVPRGKPAPDVYLEVAHRLRVAPTECAAVEDSTNGLRSAAAAGMTVIAVPNEMFPPSDDALQLATAAIGSLDELVPTLERSELEAAHAWEAEDRVPGRPVMTGFRRRVRLHQARWREAHGLPIGTQPILPKPGKPARPVGSRLPLDYANETGANFLTASALAAARARTSAVEPRQSFDHQRLWADLLWSPTLGLNLFAEVDADRLVATLWPDAPGAVREVRFVHSPGWLDPAYLGSLRAFDAAFVLEGGGILGVDVEYHERAKAETPKPENMRRYLEVAERSGAFAPGAVETVKGRSDLAVMWLEHLLLLSMIQHESGAWSSGRYVVVHPAGNTDLADLCERYRALLQDESTFSSVTLEELLDAGVHSRATAAALRERYLPSAPVRTTATRSP